MAGLGHEPPLEDRPVRAARADEQLLLGRLALVLGRVGVGLGEVGVRGRVGVRVGFGEVGLGAGVIFLGLGLGLGSGSALERSRHGMSHLTLETCDECPG